MEIENLKENMTQSEQVIDLVKLEKKDNQPQVQVQIGIENFEETCVKLEKIENKPPKIIKCTNKSSSSVCPKSKSSLILSTV